MGSPIKLPSFCQMYMSPSPHHQHNHSDFSRCLNIEYPARGSSYHPTEGYPQSPFPQSPFPQSQQTMSSCMYPNHAPSPSIVHSLEWQASDDFMSPTKENGLYRDNPHCRRRLDFNHNDYVDLSKAVPVAVAKRNERERNRVKLINTTFHTLRQHLPVHNLSAKSQPKKLSKVQTLRSAIDYIRKLEDLVEDRKEKQGLNKEHKDIKIKMNNNYDTENLLKIELGDENNGLDNMDKETKEFSTMNVYPSSSNDSSFYRSADISPTNVLSDDTRSADEFYHRGQHCAFHPHHPHHNNAEVSQTFNSPPGNRNKYNSEGGSASPAASDISAGDVLAAEDAEFIDFDLWF